MAREIDQVGEVRSVLERARTIAVLGAHKEDWRPACYVPDYLRAQGYRILPVNPLFAGETLFDATVVATVSELKEPVDFVDVFRRPEDLPAHVPELLVLRPPLVWLQLGIRHDAFAQQLIAAGIDVIQDRCTLADHRRFGIGRVA